MKTTFSREGGWRWGGGSNLMAGQGNPGRPGLPGGEWREIIPDQVFNGRNPGAPGEPGW